ncbi:MAG TPA: VIT1/CCC1 transporter family protein [Chloroflexota bacterium]|jgi:VIT1/CCC1 family predicted Fe2+/Mn2+ transporter|nr:VIT1/CCC1 transporter family protein [Chloroflexota bacterium]
MARIAPHYERHFTGSATVRDVVIGMSDGLTVPFALAAGLSGAVQNHWLVVIAGAAEMAAGSIAMGLGGYLAAQSDTDSYRAEQERERREIVEVPDVEREEVRAIFAGYGLTGQSLEAAVDAIAHDATSWTQFMMREELGLQAPEPGRALRSSVTIGGAYILGGIVPLFPYLLPLAVSTALLVSALVTLVALAVFGWAKGAFTGLSPLRSAAQTVLVGGIAAAVAYAIARLISGAAG